MKVSHVVDLLNGEVLSSGDLEALKVSGVVAGDLLSFIMAKGEPGWLWVTVQSHVNVAAVAVLREMPLIVIAAGRPVGEDLIEKCNSEGIALVKSSLSCYEICGVLYGEGLGTN